MVFLLTLSALSAPAMAQKAEAFGKLPETIQSRWNGELLELEWDDLIPEGFRADAILDQYDPEMIAQMDDNDPLMLQIMDQLEAAYRSAPVVGVLDNHAVRLGGFIVPLEMSEEGVTEFLLVPYFGACIHVPPPPSNQIIYVVTQTPIAQDALYDAIWVSGRLSVDGALTDMAQAGYTLVAEQIVPIEY